MRKLFVLLLFVSYASVIYCQNIAITDDDAYTANSSAMLDVYSLSKGMLVPRLTTAQRSAIVSPAIGLLVFDTTINGFYYYNGTSWINLTSGSSSGLFWSYSNSNIFMTNSNDSLGIGTNNPLHKIHLYQSVATTDGTNGALIDIQNYNTSTGVMSGIRLGTGTTGTPDNFKGGIFFQRNGTFNRGDLIFANNTTASATDVTVADGRLVLQNDGRIMIKGDPNSSVNTSIFAVQNSDGDTIFAVYPEGVRIWVNDDGLSKTSGNRGGFAVGGYSPSKAGFTDEYLRVTPDSVRVYIEEGTIGSKTTGSRGGFAVGGFAPSKGMTDYYFNIEYDTTEIINPSEPRMLWYPNKEAFLSGRVLVQSIDSVGVNSMATGFESKSIGNYSQAFGYHARAKGNNSTAIGNYANAETDNSFAFGDFAKATGISSYAIGSNSIASGDYSTAFGFDNESSGAYSTSFGKSTTASGQYSFSAGYNSVASGYNSYAMGLSCNATATSSFATGYSSDALGTYSYAMGYDAYCSGDYAIALGNTAYCSGNSGIAMGNSSRVDGLDGVAIGNNSEAYWDGVALGHNTNAYWGSFAVGVGANASGAHAISIGIGSVASGAYSTTIGDIEASGDYSFAIALATGLSATNIIQANTMAIMGGKVGINDVNPDAYLHVNSPTGEIPFRVQVAGNTELLVLSTGGVSIGSNHTTTPANGLYVAGNAGVKRDAVTNDLEVEGTASKTTSGNWLANSDRRIKTSIYDIDNSFETILKLRPVKFKYTDEWKLKHPSIKDQYYYNFIAQEFQQVFPESVQPSGEYIDGDDEVILQIDTYNAQIVTIKAVQELIKQNLTQKQEIDELKAQNEKILNQLDELKSIFNQTTNK